MVKISVLFVLLGVQLVRSQNAHAGYGYEYRAPAVPFHMPTNAQPDVNAQSAYYNNGQHLQNRFIPSSNAPANNFYQNQVRQPESIQYNYQSYNNGYSSYQNSNYNSQSQNFGSTNSLGAQSAQQSAQSDTVYNPSYTNTQTQQPVITKHIYFHLPPPEDSASTASVTAAHPKKIYNIIFIKLPSQKSASAARLQQLVNRQAAIENKTLIYVLVKKPETQPSQPVTSKPEVFFVKYKEPRNVIQQVNGGLVQVPAPALQPNSPGLLPGLVNGHGN